MRSFSSRSFRIGVLQEKRCFPSNSLSTRLSLKHTPLETWRPQHLRLLSSSPNTTTTASLAQQQQLKESANKVKTGGTGTLKAVYTCRKLDVLALHRSLNVGRLLEDEYLLVPLPGDTSVLASQATNKTSSGSTETDGGSGGTTTAGRRRVLAHQKAAATSEGLKGEEQDEGRHCVYFPHGAIVFFNCDEKTQKECIETSNPFAKSFLAEPETEEYEIQVDPNLENDWSKFAPNRLVLKTLDLKNVMVIATALSQAVALTYYEDEIDRMLEHIERKGGEREAVKILRESNQVLRDVILNLGLLDTASESSPAWQDERYYRIWTGLRDEFEIEKRWRVLQTKTNFLQDNLRFAVELAHARTSERLEVAIIVLITAELAISCFNVLMGHHH